jgi:hypothetical protein
LYFKLQQQKLIEFIRQGRIPEALQFAQDELAPRAEESPEFLSDLEWTMALLVFDSTPNPPTAIADLLSPAQRMKTAGEVNAAILESLSQGKEVKLMGLLKLLCWGETMLEEKAEFPKVRIVQWRGEWCTDCGTAECIGWVVFMSRKYKVDKEIEMERSRV